MKDNKEETLMTNGFIDVHHHIIPEEYKAALAEAGIEKSGGLSIGSWSPQKSLELMDALGIEKAYCSLSEPALYPIVEKDRALGRQKARMLNGYMAKLCADYPGKFGAFAVLPLPDIEGAIEEAIYALDVLRLDGVGLLSNYRDEFLGNRMFDPLFDELDKRQAVLYIHPSIPLDAEVFKRPEYVPYDYFQEFCFNTTRAASNLVFSGTLERCPNIKPILSHMGGTLPYLAWRLNECFPGNQRPGKAKQTLPAYVYDGWCSLSKPVYDYFGRFYFDCALSCHDAAFSAVEKLAPNHTLFGSDSFYASLNSGKKFVQEVEAHYTGDALDNMKRENAIRLFSSKGSAHSKEV